jgi:hypothetical protein
VDVRLSAEQRALSDSAAQVLSQLGPGTVAGLGDAERRAKLDAAAAGSGWRELRAAGTDGAPGASGVEVALVAEQLGRGLADVAFLGPTLAAEWRRRAGAPPATSPETVLLTADLAEPATSGAGGVAVDAAGCQTALVLVPDGDGFSLGAVAVRALRGGVDLTRPSAPVPASAAVSVIAGQERPISSEDLLEWTALGLATTCADLVGTMQGALDLTVAYARERRQFGAPIGSYQAVQHLVADAATSLEGSRSATLFAAWAVDALPPADALGAAAAAKSYAARAGRTVCETAIQVHGGMGNTWECLAHVYLRRALLATDAFGGVGANLRRVLEHRGIGGVDGLR